jgi:hypothetical protein
MEWPIIGPPQKPHNILLRIIDHRKYNVIVMGDEIWRKQKELIFKKNRWEKEAKCEWDISTIPCVVCKLRETVIGKVYQTQAFTTFGHF